MKDIIKFRVFVFISLISLLNNQEILAQKSRKTDYYRNRFTAIYPVKFFCNAVGEDRDVILMEANDPRFLKLRALLGTFFKPYPLPDRLIHEESQLLASNRLYYEKDSVPIRHLESWYFIPDNFLRKSYDFVAIEGKSQIDDALVLLDSIWKDPINKDSTAIMWACANNYAAIQVYKGNIAKIVTFLNKFKESNTLNDAAAPWNWHCRALENYEYYTRKTERADTVYCMDAKSKPIKVGTLNIAPQAYIKQPYLNYRWGVFEIPPVIINDVVNRSNMLVNYFNDGSRRVLWTGVRCEPVVNYLFVPNKISLGANSYSYNNEGRIPTILSLVIENKGETTVPFDKVSFSLIIEGQSIKTEGHLYEGSEQNNSVGLNTQAFNIKPGFIYQLHINGPNLEALKKVDSFVLRILDMPQQLSADGAVSKRGLVNIAFDVDLVEEIINVKYFPMQSPMVCRADYVAMKNIPAMNKPAYTKQQLIIPKRINEPAVIDKKPIPKKK